jgi:hypothetical protein
MPSPGLGHYRRLNTIIVRSKERFIAFVEIAFISILFRRLERLVGRGAKRLTCANNL